ncbi:hypothetical protein SADUNF_Sadunf04G0107700 [Salix dunnii]|uniref:Uncharacterized protein n=1 Tax=Salix dunnii TaxID=1413687 RepID=A0A835N2W2_9ROSI|nr:hypothetical protein SADUNF_Sadunf04G0107700 [Salix dunnii]
MKVVAIEDLYRFYISPVLTASCIQYGLRRVVNRKLCETNNRECESLQAMAVGLRTEWSKLKAEMDNLLEKCEREELTKLYGRDRISDLIAMESDAETESDNDEETTLSEQNQTADSSRLLEVRR